MAFQVGTPKSDASTPSTRARTATWSVAVARVVRPVVAVIRAPEVLMRWPVRTLTVPDFFGNGAGAVVASGVSTVPSPGTEGMSAPGSGRGVGSAAVAGDAAF